MVTSVIMGKNFSYTLIGGWFKAEACGNRPELAGLLPHQKLLLLSDGSLTLDLELLYGESVHVEVVYKGGAPLTVQDAAFMQEEPGQDAVEREVWLTIGGRRLVYAHTLMPTSRVEPLLLASLEKHSAEPIGRVLTANNIAFTKEKLNVGFVRCACGASDLGIDRDTPLAARQYLLVNRAAGGVFNIKALVTEVFSPEVVPCALTGGGKEPA